MAVLLCRKKSTIRGHRPSRRTQSPKKKCCTRVRRRQTYRWLRTEERRIYGKVKIFGFARNARRKGSGAHTSLGSGIESKKWRILSTHIFSCVYLIVFFPPKLYVVFGHIVLAFDDRGAFLRRVCASTHLISAEREYGGRTLPLRGGTCLRADITTRYYSYGYLWVYRKLGGKIFKVSYRVSSWVYSGLADKLFLKKRISHVKKWVFFGQKWGFAPSLLKTD